MTEAEWLSSANPIQMVQACRRFMQGHARKGRLFAVACCYRIWHLLEDQRSRSAVEAAALFAEGLTDTDQLEAAAAAARTASVEALQQKGEVRSNAELAARFAADPSILIAVQRVSSSAFVAAGDGPKLGPEHVAQCHLLRCIFGPLPFRPVAADPFWRAGNGALTVRLAQAIYDECAFDRLPILADALEDAGCTDRALLDHCRGPGPHVRGCWVVDLILGKQ